ncbi:MAG TPA: DNA internalization-related competence protein ComEC/Rec2, partial [Dongiaceae bacterium]|nr:DNA internalization-related competence protein ComEC/Rec2 [Dongiaceae bacterium]
MSRRAPHAPFPLHPPNPPSGSHSSLVLLALTVAFGAGIAAAGDAGPAWTIAVAAIAGGALGGMAPLRSRGGPGRAGRVATFVLLALLACGAGAGLAAGARAGDPGPRLLAEWRRRGFEAQGSPARLAGTIEDLERIDGDRAALVVRADRAAVPAGETWSRVTPACRIRLTLPWPERDPLPWQAGDRFETTARVALPRSYGNPGAFDYGLYLAARGISLVGQVKSARLLESRPPEGAAIATLPARLRARLVDRLAAAAGPDRQPTAAFLAALLFGERQALDPAFETTLQRAGVYHVLALSGFNVACVLMAAGLILGLVPMPPSSRRLLLLLLAAAYVLLARSSGSILRAGLMVVLHGSGRIAGRRTSALGALLVSALVLLAIRPVWLADAGFQLSYLATGALLLSGPPPRWRRPAAPGVTSLGRRLDRRALAVLSTLLGMLLAGFAAFVATAPLTARQFQTVTPAGIVANLVVVPGAALALLLGGVAIAALGVSPAITAWCIPPAAWLLRRIAATSERAASWPLGNLFVVPPGWGLALATLAALGGSRLLSRPGARRLAASAALLLGAAILGAGRGDSPPTGRLDLVAWDVGQGDSILVRTPGGATVLIDTGGLGRGDFDVGSKVVAPALRTLGILRLDVLALTHAHRDHVGGAASILAQFRPRALWLGALPADEAVTRRLEAAATAVGSVVLRPRAGVTIDLAGARFEVLHPGRDAPPRDRANDQSLVLRVVAGTEAALLTGDIEADVERMLLDRGRSLSASLLKVAHHGSRTSTGSEFLEAVGPRAALISVGAANPWGHPSETVLERLRRAGVAVFRTDVDG